MYKETRRLVQALRAEGKLNRFIRNVLLPLFQRDRSVRRPIFVMSPASSGSTWIAGLLGNLPTHVFVHEVKILGGPTRRIADWLIRMPEPVSSRACFVLLEAFQRARLWTLASHAAHLKTRPELLSEFNLRPFDLEHPEATDGLVDVVNSAGSNIHLAPLLRHAYPNAVLCYVVRDPRDVCASISRRKPFGGRRSVEGWAEAYMDTYQAFRAYKDSCGIDVLRYEEWVRDTEGQLKAFLERHGLAMEADALRAAVYRHDARAMRAGKTKRVGNLAKGATGTWRSDLSQAEQRAVSRVLKDTLAELGYASGAA